MTIVVAMIKVVVMTKMTRMRIRMKRRSLIKKRLAKMSRTNKARKRNKAKSRSLRKLLLKRRRHLHQAEQTELRNVIRKTRKIQNLEVVKTQKIKTKTRRWLKKLQPSQLLRI